MAGKLSGCRLSRRKSMSVITLHHAKKKKGIVISPVFNAFSSARAGTTKKLALPTSESCSFSNMPWVVVVGVVWNVRVATIMCARV